MAKRRILVVDDDPRAADLARICLEREGYEVLTAYDGHTGLELARTAAPDLAVLDLMLPGISGLDICRLLREESQMPIIMLTARSTEDDKSLGLGLGADDYVAKPLSPRELVARVGAVLRRLEERVDETDEDISRGPLTLSFRRREVLVSGRKVTLTASEFRLLAVLAREPGRAFTRHELLERVLGADFEGSERDVDLHLENACRKLGFGSTGPIKSIYGLGYVFEEA
ncbi:MAG: response regulator transcription factor [Chloroflexi bacterium]|nr:response regulator transcription factor [Chloroflexota bacterium]